MDGLFRLRTTLVGAAFCALLAPGCGKPASRYGTGQIEFQDNLETNATPPEGALEFEFLDSNGGKVRLADYRGQKNVVLVMTRGFAGSICPYCSAQTSRLIANYAEFQKRDAEILLVYPGDRMRIPEFLAAVEAAAGEKKTPFPVLLDEDLKAVTALGIRDDLAKPSTYIVDKEGKLRFAYVGSSLADRPSVKAMLDQLDAANGR